MMTQFQNSRFYIIICTDVVIFVTALVGAFLLRFDFTLDSVYLDLLIEFVLFLIPGKIVIFLLFGLYRGMWRYTGIHDFRQLVKATLFSMLFYITVTFFIHGHSGIPRSIYLIDAMLTFIFCGGLRLSIRMAFAKAHSKSRLPLCFSKNKDRGSIKVVLIIGAGGAGEKMLREIQDNPHLDYKVVGFLDDDPNKWGRHLHGLKIFGGADRIPVICKQNRIDEVLIATPAATGAQIRRIIEICKSCEARYRTLPEIGAIIDGKISIKSMRDVKYEDLLRRSPVRLDNSICLYIQGKRVLVTGAGGSIGSELCRQLVRFYPQELILMDSSEANLYGIQMELQHEHEFSNHHCVLGRVQERTTLNNVFRDYQPQLIFHAAAYKHVPMLEKNPWEAIFNNVQAIQVAIDLALQYNVERFVFVSTDKAVRPTSVMGASKRLGELILQAQQGNGTRFMSVRFGNVIGSSGSVLPIFRRQLEHGGPITVTHPEVTRYFMTTHEAAQLILHAGGLGDGGEIFILEMGTPVKIAQMAEDLVRLSGKIPGKDIEIIFTGLREGEKLYEELITEGEGIVPTIYEKILMLRPTGWNGKNNQAEFIQWLQSSLDDLYQIANTQNTRAIILKLSEILPDYIPQEFKERATPYSSMAY